MYSSILFIDDDYKILKSFKRSLTPEYRVFVAENPEEGLRIFEEKGPFSVLISDMRMPGMNGVEVLSKAYEIDADTSRVLLTGYADQQAAIDAVNKGRIFKFLTKPCPMQTLIPVLEEGIYTYKLNVSKRFIGERTQQGLVGMLSQILAMVNPTAQRKASRLKNFSRHMARGLRPQQRMLVEMAAVLSQLGCLNLSQETMMLYDGGGVIGQEDNIRIREQFDVASRLLMHLPRFEVIIEILGLLQKSPHQFPAYDDPEMQETIPLCSRILQTAIGLDLLLSTGKSPDEALNQLRADQPFYDPALVDRLNDFSFELHNEVLLYVRASELTPRMILAEDIRDKDGTLLATKGQPMANPLLTYLHKVHRRIGLPEPIGVFLPLQEYEI
nr:response regulator [uncultured Desulfobulbus sp.]